MIEKNENNGRRIYAMTEGQSSSPPSGNLVDGLPLVCSTRAVVYEMKMSVPKNDAPPPENDRGDDVLLDDIEKCSQVSLWNVL